jgi:hypothetical protein
MSFPEFSPTSLKEMIYADAGTLLSMPVERIYLKPETFFVRNLEEIEGS